MLLIMHYLRRIVCPGCRFASSLSPFSDSSFARVMWFFAAMRYRLSPSRIVYLVAVLLEDATTFLLELEDRRDELDDDELEEATELLEELVERELTELLELDEVLELVTLEELLVELDVLFLAFLCFLALLLIITTRVLELELELFFVAES